MVNNSLTDHRDEVWHRYPLPAEATSKSWRSMGWPKRPQPRSFEIGAGLVEGNRRATRTFPRMAAGIEAAMPLPRILVMRNASADRDRAGVHIAIVDVPAFLR